MRAEGAAVSGRRRYGIDVGPLLGNRTGIGRYVAELVDGLLPLLAEDEELVLFAGTFRRNPLCGVSHRPLHARAAHPQVRCRRMWAPYRAVEPLWRALGRPTATALCGGVEVFHGANFTLPPPGRGVRGLATIHDLAAGLFEDTVTRGFRARFLRRIADAAQRADLLVTDSEATRRDVIERLAVDPARVVPVHLGVSDTFRQEGDAAEDRDHLLREYGIAAPYVLFVGTTRPRKNLPALLRAFARLAGDGVAGRALPHGLVLVGDPGLGSAAVAAQVERLGVAGRVAAPGYVKEADLPRLYRAADALAFPSLHEGFGLPVLEAQAAGCPVLTSNVSALPEVAGDGAILVDPRDDDAIADGLLRVLTDTALRADLRERGRANSTRFRWEQTARVTLELYRRLAAEQSSDATGWA